MCGMNKIWVNIQNAELRKQFVWILVDSGYTVRVIKKEQSGLNQLDTLYWVVFEVPDNNIEGGEV